MYPVSNDFISAMLAPVIQSKIAGTIDATAFTEANILSGSLRIYAQNSGTDSIDIGTASAKELNITFMHSLNLTRSTLYGKEIELTYKLLTAPNTYEDVPLGKYIIAEANWTLKGIEIVAYDYMSKFDALFDETTAEYPASGKAYNQIKWLCDQRGVELGMTEAEMDALPNGTIMMEYVKDTASSYREYIAFLAAALGCYAIVDRTNKLIFKRYSDESYETYGATDRLTGAKFSDFMTRYNGFYVTDFASSQNVLVKTSAYVGLTMDLGKNPFLNSNSKVTLRQNVLTEIANINFAPFSAKFNFPPIYDLGDCVKLTGGIGDDNAHVVNYWAWQYNQSLTLEGYGSNPALATAQSAIDQKISGMATFTDLLATGYITTTNRKDLTVSDEKKVTVVSMAAQASKTAEGVFTAMIPINMTEAGSVTFYHELNYTELRNETVDLPEGLHIVTLHDYMTFPAGQAVNFRVRAITDGAEMEIDEFAARASLLVPSAQAAMFDGTLELEDDAERWDVTDPTFEDSDDEITLITIVPDCATLTDTAEEWDVAEPSIDDVDDSIRIITRMIPFDRVLEEEENGEVVYRITEEEDYRMTEEE